MATIMTDIRDYHLDVSELGEIAEEGNVKRFSLNHFSPLPQSKSQLKMTFIKPLEEKYDGEIIVGDDGRFIQFQLIDTLLKY